MWTAIALWVTTLAACGAYGVIAGQAVAAGGSAISWIVGVPLVYLGFIVLLCAVYFTIAWFWRARRPREVQLSWRGTLRLIWNEFSTLVGAAPRMMFYGWLVGDPARAPVDVPVVLLHGVLCNAGVWWRMSRFLTRAGTTGLYSLSYGPPLASIESFADQLAAKIDAVLEATGAPSVMIVAHSMGGLVVRAYIRRCGTKKIARVLTIGTPHHGSVLAWLFHGASLAQLRPGNPWLVALNRERLDPSLRFVSVWSWHDSMVAPQTSAELPGAVDVTLVGVGHNALLGDREVFERVHAEIEAARVDARRLR
jgi:triacylglycerol esterase/lipase EstA (alpha/beta hydrolase family)